VRVSSSTSWKAAGISVDIEAVLAAAEADVAGDVVSADDEHPVATAVTVRPTAMK
jgi:hypothetical protein